MKFLVKHVLLVALILTANILQAQLTNDLSAIEATTPLSADQVPLVGTFYSAGNPQLPAIPGNMGGYPAWDLGGGIYLLDDLDPSLATFGGGFHAMDDSAPFPGGLATNGDSPSYTPPPPIDYGTNLWIAQQAVVSGTFTGILSNTMADVEYQLFSVNSLNSFQWVSQGFVLGSETTNWTPWSLSFSPTTNFFLTALSWQDDTGTGIPDWWWLKYFGQDTNVDPYADPIGDGWTLLQDYQNRWNPDVFQTPPAPEGLTVTSYNSVSNWATLTWLPSAGAVTGYTMQTPSGNISLPNSSQIYVDYSSSSSASYKIQADYAAGNSAWSALAPVPANQNTLQAALVGGPLGSAYLAVSAIPTNTVSLEIEEIGISVITNFSILVANPTNGFYLVPNFIISFGNPTTSIYATAIDANGERISASIGVGSTYGMPEVSDARWIVPPYFDGRVQMKQNLSFLLKAANDMSPFSFQDYTLATAPEWSYSPNYVYDGFYRLTDFNYSYEGSFDVFHPFEENYKFRNFVFNSTNVDSNGDMTTGIGGPGFDLSDPVTFQFNVPITNGAIIPSLLGTNDAEWLYPYPYSSSDVGISVSFDAGDNVYAYMSNNIPNYFGLPFTSVAIVWGSANDDYFILNAGNTVEDIGGTLYPATTEPEFQTLEYDFWTNARLVFPDSTNVPGTIGFSTTYTNSLIITSVGNNQFQVSAYAKLGVINSIYSDVYGYLGQYYTNAYQIDGSGNVTTNLAGMLSPYGQFFATVPGPAALMTMPDIDTGEQGTCIVYCVSLQVDKNHDGVMDTNFFGSDATSQANPMKFWVNNGCDVPGVNHPDQDSEVPPATPNYTTNQITCRRDLENFARLWICGLPAALSNENYYVTLSCTAISGSPAINLYYAETNGGTSYLTDTNNANGLVGESAIATISPANSYVLPLWFFNGQNQHFMFEGAGIGKGQFTLTIYQGANVIAQTSTFIDLHDVQDLYEQAHIANVSKTFPGMRNNTNASTFVSDHVLASDSNETNQLAVFVHGWRMGLFDYQDFSDTMYKRLYWQGYQGRFASLRWPTLSKDDFRFFSSLEAYQTYNASEYIAFRSAQGVSDYFDWLKSRFPDYSINVAAHSMGNIVMMETLKLQLANGHKDIDNYVLMQGAVPAACYDASVPGCPSLLAQELDSPTPNEYLTYPGTINSAINGVMINFFNTNDFALNFWIANEFIQKPDGTLGYTVLPILQTYLFPGTLITDSREIMAFSARPRSFAVGAQSDVQGIISEENQVDLAAQFGFGDAYWDHSGEFNRDIQQTAGFYRALLNALFLQ